MQTYNAQQALLSIDQHIGVIAIGLVIALGLTFVYFYEAIRLGIKHRTFSSPLGATLWFLPHDFSFLLYYDQWFNVYNHWWPKIWWMGLVSTVFIEMFLLYQVVRYGREELMPKASQRTFAWSVVGMTLGCGVIWAVVKGSIDDELFFTSFLLTIAWPIPFTTMQILRRGSRKGVSVLKEEVIAPMFLGLWAALCFIDPFFRSLVFIALAVVSVVWALVNVVLVMRLPVYRAGDEAGDEAARQTASRMVAA